MESMRDIDRAMEREIAKGSCPLRFVRIEFNNSPYQEIASEEKLLEVLSYYVLMQSISGNTEKAVEMDRLLKEAQKYAARYDEPKQQREENAAEVSQAEPENLSEEPEQEITGQLPKEEQAETENIEPTPEADTEKTDQPETEDISKEDNIADAEDDFPDIDTNAVRERLAKVEELEECNYNMIDNVLNNEKPKEEKEKQTDRISIKEKLAEKKAVIEQRGRVEKEVPEKGTEKKSEREI